MECEREDWYQRGWGKKEKVLLRNPLLVGQVSSPTQSQCKTSVERVNLNQIWIFLQTPELRSAVPAHPRTHPCSRLCHLCRLHCLLQKMRRKGVVFFSNMLWEDYLFVGFSLSPNSLIDFECVAGQPPSVTASL